MSDPKPQPLPLKSVFEFPTFAEWLAYRGGYAPQEYAPSFFLMHRDLAYDERLKLRLDVEFPDHRSECMFEDLVPTVRACAAAASCVTRPEHWAEMISLLRRHAIQFIPREQRDAFQAPALVPRQAEELRLMQFSIVSHLVERHQQMSAPIPCAELIDYFQTIYFSAAASPWEAGHKNWIHGFCLLTETWENPSLVSVINAAYRVTDAAGKAGRTIRPGVAKLIKHVTADGLMSVKEDIPLGSTYEVDLNTRSVQSLLNLHSHQNHQKEMIGLIGGGALPTELLEITELEKGEIEPQNEPTDKPRSDDNSAD